MNKLLILLSILFINFSILENTAINYDWHKPRLEAAPTPTALKLKQPLDFERKPILHKSPKQQPLKPLAITLFPLSSPASEKPFLTWTIVPGAVSYEVEILGTLPEQANNNSPSVHRITADRQVYVNGYNADLTAIKTNPVYWRVRALNLDGQALGVFSDAQPIFIDHNKQQTLRPRILTIFNDKERPTPLYPAYSWIPINGAVKYEVELLNHEPENPYSIAPSIYRIWSKTVTGFCCYDNEPRKIPGKYYWRVRGLDANNKPIGVFSDTGSFTVALKNRYIATFGDSITHGGGSISHSPTNWEYSYQTYLDFVTINLGKSGDTSSALVKRFDEDVLPFSPKQLIILGGTNSLRSGIKASIVIADLTAIRDKCITQGIRPIFLTLPPINPKTIEKLTGQKTAPDWREQFDIVNNFIRHQQYYIDIEQHLSDTNRELPDYYGIDGLHPDIEGKKIIAKIINDNWSKVTQ